MESVADRRVGRLRVRFQSAVAILRIEWRKGERLATLAYEAPSEDIETLRTLYAEAVTAVPAEDDHQKALDRLTT